MSSIDTAASALRNHQTFMNVVANNIANMNTIGFKSSSILFQDMLSRSLRNGSGPAENRGGINPMQVGLGMRLGSVQNNMTQGMMQTTGRGQDLAITGSGFFIYSDGGQQIYSRDGAMGMDSEGNMVNLGTGLRVQGWQADAQGNIDTTKPLANIEIPVGAPMAAVETTDIRMAGSLDASTAVADSVPTSIQFYDSLGGLHSVDMSFTKDSANNWSVSMTTTDPDVTLGPLAPGTIEFDTDGQLIAPADGVVTFTGTMGNGAGNVTIELDLSNMTQLDTADSQLYVTEQNGRTAGEMLDFSISELGEVVGIYSNGLRRNIGQLATAEFVNPAALKKIGQNGWIGSGNSGEPQVVAAGNRSTISAGFLEMSNVDLTMQFSDMIRAQRGFQANSRVITSSDEMIQELVNIVR